jgi:SAM-dependent methyltransferase
MAHLYDRTRIGDPLLGLRLVSMLVKLLAEAGPCLEVGIGTGRIGIPLQRLGIPVIGVDISLPMLRTFRTKGHTAAQMRVVQADAQALPFASGTFGASLLFNVLYLAPSWVRVLTEVMRVVRRAGTIIVSDGDYYAAWSRATVEMFLAEAQADTGPSRFRFEDVDAFMEAAGAGTEPVWSLEQTRTNTLEAVIARLEEGAWSCCAGITPAVRHAAASSTRKWAVKTFGSLTEERATPLRIELHVYRFRAL